MLTANYVGHREIDIRQQDPQQGTTGQVQIEVAYTGICGTDLHIFHRNRDAHAADYTNGIIPPVDGGWVAR